METHLADCQSFSKDDKFSAPRNRRKRRTTAKLTAREGLEFRAHFRVFNDPNFAQNRAGCRYCDYVCAELLIRMEGHLAQCTMIPKGISFPRPPRDFRLCSYCGRVFLAECIDEHRRSCRQVYYYCENCKTSRIPAAGRKGHLLNCPKKKCSWCNVILLRVDMDVHRNTCSFMACSRCRKKKMTMAEFAAHQKICMPLIRCTQCGETNPSSMKDHLETCNYRRCTLCGKWKISLEQLYSHQLACIKLRRCKGCNQSGRSISSGFNTSARFSLIRASFS